MIDVLLLNADFTPLDTISVERALILYFTDKIEIIHAKVNKFIHTITSSCPFPEVVRLKRYIYLHRKEMSPTKKNIFERDLYECQYCGNTKHLTIDHIVPVSRGGQNTWKNLTTCCFSCNNKKGDRLQEECGMKLKRQPGRPSHLHIIKKFSKDNDLKTWENYIFM